MRTTENLTVSLPPAVKRQMERVAKRENRTLSELVRETFRHYQKPSVDIYELIRQIAPTPPETLAMREDAKRAGADKLTMAQIQRQVRAVRNQHDRQHAGKNRQQTKP
jgi:Arc/MetJ-type ribon-helix-helix transcriptional regulator